MLDTSEDVNLIMDKDHVEHNHDGHSCGDGVEPNIWKSTENAYIIARNTYKALCQLDKENEQYYLQRYDSLCNIIQETDSIICNMLNSSDKSECLV